MGQSSRELNKEYWQGATAGTDGRPQPCATSSTAPPSTGSPAPGSSGSAWRMSKLRRTYEMAEEEGRPVEDVAVERYGSIELFREAQEERRVLDERDSRRRGRRSDAGPGSNSRTQTPTQEGRRFVFTDAPGSADSSRPASRGAFRRPGEEARAPLPPPPALNRSTSGASTSSSTAAGPNAVGSNNSSRPQTPVPSVFTPPAASRRAQSGLSQSVVLVPDPTSSSNHAAAGDTKPPLTQSELNKLQAKVLKAKLMGAGDADALEREYEAERKRRDEAGPEVLEGNVAGTGGREVRVLPTLDGRGRLYDVGTGQAEEESDRSGKRKKKEKVWHREVFRGLIVACLRLTCLSFDQVFESRDRRTGEVLRHNADDDTTTLAELVRQERFSGGASGQKNMDHEMANRIATDARFDNDLDYIDENAERLARRKMKSEVMKKAFAVQGE